MGSYEIFDRGQASRHDLIRRRARDFWGTTVVAADKRAAFAARAVAFFALVIAAGWCMAAQARAPRPGTQMAAVGAEIQAGDNPDLSNAKRVPAVPSSPQPSLLFSSGFATDTTLRPVEQANCWPKGCWQDIEGTDSITRRYTGNATWPPHIWRGGARFQLIADVPVTAVTIGSYMFNQIRTTIGHTGRPTQALYSEINRGPDGKNPIRTAATQNSFQLLPVIESGDFYISFWLKFQPDLVQQMTGLPPGPGVIEGGTWRAFFEWKTGTPGRDDGDYRVAAYVMTYGGGAPYWAVGGDNVAGGGYPLVNDWSIENRSVLPVPAGAWFKFEAFWHRSSGVDGRVWMAIDGHVIADRYGANVGSRRQNINRIFWNLYSGSRLPVYQWIDDVQIWDGFPTATSSLPWYDPPYAPH